MNKYHFKKKYNCSRIKSTLELLKSQGKEYKTLQEVRIEFVSKVISQPEDQMKCFYFRSFTIHICEGRVYRNFFNWELEKAREYVFQHSREDFGSDT